MKISSTGKPSHVDANRNSHRFRRSPPDEFGASCQGGHEGRGRGTDWLLLCVAHVQADIKKVRSRRWLAIETRLAVARNTRDGAERCPA
jgi:hypothetical protein